MKKQTGLENATERPWRYTRNDVKKEYGVHHDNVFIRSGEKVICEVWEENEANASLIIRAVNSYDALVEALERSNQHNLHSRGLVNPDTAAYAVLTDVIKQNANALKLAKGE